MARRAALVTGSILVLLLAAELVLRIWGAGGPPSPVGEFHPRLGWSLEPGRTYRLPAPPAGARTTYRVAPDGMRAVPGEADELSLLLLGGAPALGLGVDRPVSFAGRLETLLRERGLPLRVRAGGGDHYGLGQLLLWFRERGAKLRPALVVLVLDQLAIRPLVEERWRGWPKPRFALPAAKGMQPVNLPLAPPERPLLALLALVGGGPEKGGEGAVLPGGHAVLLRERPPATRRAWRLARGLLGELRREVRLAGGLLLALAWPEPFQLRGEEVHRLAAAWGVEVEELFIDLASMGLADLCRAQGVEWVGTVGPFRAAAKGGLTLHRPGSRLPTPAACRILARLTARRLVELRWRGLGRRR